MYNIYIYTSMKNSYLKLIDSGNNRKLINIYVPIIERLYTIF